VERNGIQKKSKNALRLLLKIAGDAKKRGHKVRDRKKGDHKKDSGFGKLVRDDAKIKELKEAFAKAAKERRGAFDKAGWKDATDEEKKALREKMAASRKEWVQQMRASQKEVHARIKEIRAEFKNNRDKVIDGNDPGE
jgi:seryl-tRNA synthetase